MADVLLLVDGYSLIYRAFFAIRNLLTTSTGQPTNATYGFTKMLRKILREQSPTHAAVVLDRGESEARIAALETYKAQRKPMPPELQSQLPHIRQILDAMRIPVLESEGIEADDIIATLAARFAERGGRTLIASGDKDFMQLVDDRIQLVRPEKEGVGVWDAAAVAKRYGVSPHQIADLLALTGDSVDNIPGISGVGEKTAAEIIQKFGDIDALLARADEISKPKLRDAIKENAEQIQLNRKLIALDRNVPFEVDWQTLRCQKPDYEKLREAFQTLEFKSLLAEIEAESA
jgi:DNA polymerase-1